MSTFLIVYLVALACNLVIGAYFFREDYNAGKPLSLAHALLYFGFIFVPYVNAACLMLGGSLAFICAIMWSFEWLCNKCASITVLHGRDRD